ncbi:helix-turn-helix domain-containing protein [Parafilimonas sp.]|uniref:helix-turn-helix domain-containing protein n=1 Tax=Parafilimonas sp. TaxID=1969739 RepID=UPI0039E27434
MMKFSIPGHVRVQTTLLYKVPVRYKHYKIPHAEAVYAKGPVGNFLTQVIKYDDFHIQLNIFHILQAVCLLPVAAEPVIALHFMLENDIPCELAGFGPVLLAEGLFHLFFVPAHKKNKAFFEQGFYVSFHVDNTQKFIQMLAGKYAELEEVLQMALMHSDKGVRQHPAYITPAVRNITFEDMLKCKKEEPERHLFFEARIMDLLLAYVDDGNKGKAQHASRMAEDIHAFIMENLQHWINMEMLSKKFRISKPTLQHIFYEAFHITIHQFIIEKRLEIAHELLMKERLSVKEAAFTSGFKSVSTFIKEFYKKYRATPGTTKK